MWNLGTGPSMRCCLSNRAHDWANLFETPSWMPLLAREKGGQQRDKGYLYPLWYGHVPSPQLRDQKEGGSECRPGTYGSSIRRREEIGPSCLPLKKDPGGYGEGMDMTGASDGHPVGI